MEESTLPVYKIVDEGAHQGTLYWIIGSNEVQLVPQELRESFKHEEEVTHSVGTNKTIFISAHKARKATLSTDVTIRVSKTASEVQDFQGILSDLISSIYKFNRKSKRPQAHVISLEKTVFKVHKIISLAEARNRAREWANGRGDVQGSPEYFRKIAEDFAKETGVELTVIKGQDLLKEGFRLMHAVGRASKNEPIFVNLAYKGNPDSNEWVAFVGKGVCFDTGGYNLKTTAGIKDMFLDKHGAMSCLSAFQSVVREKLSLNLTCSIGLVENFVGENAYRPSDIITSRKGLTVEIGNTDAEGRLVLADCMHWTQQKFKTSVLIQLSTLTGAMITALGSEFAGLFTNDKELAKALRRSGQKVHELVWHMPVTDYHKKLVSPKHCDLTNSSGKVEAGASQAAAFLKCFVEQGTKWVHLDIAGASMAPGEATGWGARILLKYARSVSVPLANKSETE